MDLPNELLFMIILSTDRSFLCNPRNRTICKKINSILNDQYIKNKIMKMYPSYENVCISEVTIKNNDPFIYNVFNLNPFYLDHNIKVNLWKWHSIFREFTDEHVYINIDTHLNKNLTKFISFILDLENHLSSLSLNRTHYFIKSCINFHSMYKDDKHFGIPSWKPDCSFLQLKIAFDGTTKFYDKNNNQIKLSKNNFIKLFDNCSHVTFIESIISIKKLDYNFGLFNMCINFDKIKLNVFK